MKLRYHKNESDHFQNSERGFASITVFALIVIVGALAVSNNIVLAQLQREINLIEHRQLLRSGAIAMTNQPALRRGSTHLPNRVKPQ